MAKVLDQLCAALRGQPPADADWTAMVNLANQSLVTPTLAAAVPAPPDVAPFLDEVLARNRERNRRLFAQLDDALAPLNAAGVTPVLLKGAALRVTVGEPFDRLLSDIDLLVGSHEVEPAIAALQAAGFGLAQRYPGASVHVVAELGRPQDVGYLDLHQRPPGPPAIAATTGRLVPARLPGGEALVPDPATQILHLVLHDQFHDGDYWRGGFDLRHLLDLTRLAPRLTPADWTWLRNACGPSLVRRALEAQLNAARHLFAGAAPSLTVRRWRLQHEHPALRLPLAALTVLLEWQDLAAYRAADRAGRRDLAVSPERVTPARRLERIRKIAAVASGKI